MSKYNSFVLIFEFVVWIIKYLSGTKIVDWVGEAVHIELCKQMWFGHVKECYQGRLISP